MKNKFFQKLIPTKKTEKQKKGIFREWADSIIFAVIFASYSDGVLWKHT